MTRLHMGFRRRKTTDDRRRDIADYTSPQAWLPQVQVVEIKGDRDEGKTSNRFTC